MGSVANVFSSPYSQGQRLLRLSFPHDDAPGATDAYGRSSTPTIVIERLEAEEGLSRDFKYTLTLLADSAGIALKDMLGKLLAVSLVRPDGSLRWFTGHVFEFELAGSDAGVATYRAVLRPWLWFTTLRINNRVFRDQSLRQITATVLEDHSPLPRWEWCVRGDDPLVTMAVQGAGWGESDHSYLHRRWEQAGYSYHWEHARDGHTLVLTDDTTTQCKPVDASSPRVRFQAKGGPAEEEGIQAFSPVREIASGTFSASAFNFKSPTPRHAQVPTLNRQGEVPSLDVHAYAGAYGFRKENTGGDAFVRLRMEEIEAGAKRQEAEGNHHGIQSGRWFELTDHFSCEGSPAEDNQYLVVEARHVAANNYLQTDSKSEYRNSFVASRRAVPWRPGLGLNSQPLRVLAPQTATVVGDGGMGSLDIDEYGRILIQYHWDREARYSARVRVSSGWAGGETGMVSWPRVGSEVIVQCLDGNADHPLVTGVVYNQAHMPPWTVPSQKSLTGIRSRELQGDGGNQPGGRSNHLILDDTDKQIQAKLRSDEQASELSLGHIVRIDSTLGRKHQGGQGAELRTDGHGAIRAASGLLLTTEARPNADAHLTDMGETVARLTAARDLHEGLSEAAMQAKAHEGGDSDAVTKELKKQNDEVKGTGPGNKAQGQFPEFQAPHLTIASPAGIEATTAGSTHIAATEHIATTSAGHTSVAAGKSLLVSAKEAVRIAAVEQGMRLIAANADIDLQALKDSINVLAKLNIKMEAQRITITAKEEIVINGGTSYTRWNASGIVSGTSGVWREHAASHSLVGPHSVNAEGHLPESRYKGCAIAAQGASASQAATVILG